MSKLNKVLRILRGDVVGFDVESWDPKLKALGPGFLRGDASAVGLALASDTEAVYVHWGHPGGSDNMERVVLPTLRAFRERAQTAGKAWVAHNAAYDLTATEHDRFIATRWSERAVVHCTAVLAKRADSRYLDKFKRRDGDGYDLSAVALRYGYEPKREEGMLNAWLGMGGEAKTLKSNIAKLPGSVVEEYAEHDARLTRNLLDDLLEDVPSHLVRISMLCNMALHRMYDRGLRVDIERLTELTKEYSAIERSRNRKLQIECMRLVGMAPTSSKAKKGLHEAAIEAAKRMGVELPLTDTGAVSLDAAALQPLARYGLTGEPTNFFGLLEHAREAATIHSQAKGLLKHIAPDGCVHARVNQFGTVTGRMSCSTPNLQQQSARRKIAKDFRSIYIAHEEGLLFGGADYPSQEPRTIAEIAAQAGDPSMRDAYIRDPHLDLYIWIGEEMTGLDRGTNKTILLARAYGRGAASTGRQLGEKQKNRKDYEPLGWTGWGLKGQLFTDRQDALDAMVDAGIEPPDDGPGAWEVAPAMVKDKLAIFDNGLPAIKVADTYCREMYEEGDHYITNLYGGRLYCGSPHKALNTNGQGSAGEQTRMALAQAFDENPKLRLGMAIHDEIIGSFENLKQARDLGRAMGEVAKEYGVDVPFPVACKLGLNWKAVK